MSLLKYIKPFFCEHKWDMENINVLPFRDEDNNYYITYTCSKCGFKYTQMFKE